MKHTRLGDSGPQISRIAMGCMSFGDTSRGYSEWALDDDRFDPDTPVEETMEALHDVVTSGKARYLGASSMWAWQFAKMQYAADINGWTRFVSMQDQYNLMQREEEREMFSLLADQGSGCSRLDPQQSCRRRAHRRTDEASSPR
jgi:aryl-alcohol dehydrogenase-like predicted oxidoreductase